MSEKAREEISRIKRGELPQIRSGNNVDGLSKSKQSPEKGHNILRHGLQSVTESYITGNDIDGNQ